MIYFTADTHFGHNNVIKYCNRPFSDTTEMDEQLITNWNEVVKSNDTIYHLGDFGFCSREHMQHIFNRLNGKKHLILGNHDDNRVKKLGWESVDYYKELKYNGLKFILFHYPIESWNGKHHRFLHLHGHIHDNIVDNCEGTRYNVGVDVWNYRPVSIEEFI